MALHLGIDIGRELTVAAVERDGAPGVVRLGDDAAMPSVAHVGTDGSVVVGDAAYERARAEPAGLVPDVAGRLGTGPFEVQGLEVDGGLLVGHLLAEVVGQVVARHGRRPDSVRLVHPDGWSLAQVDALLAAADDAGLTDVAALPASEARAALRRRRLAAGDAVHEAVIGAAIVAGAAGGAVPEAPPSDGPPGIVTREDLEGPAPPPPLRPPPSYESSGPRSVFETQAVPAAPAAGPPPTAAMPAVGAAGGGGGWDGVLPPDDGDDDDNPSRWIWAAVAGVAAVLAVVVLVLVLAGGDDGDDVATDTTTSLPATTSTLPPTTAPVTTTAPTTTTVAPTTTIATTTTATSTTTTTTTTVPALGPVGISDFGLVLRPGASNSDDVLFGEDPDTAVNLVRGLLGAPDSDSGWRTDEVCEGTKTRRVRWGSLELTFTQQGADDAADRTREFTQWFADNTATTPEGLRTLERVGVGDRVEAFERVYGDNMTLEVGQGGRGRFEVVGPSDGVIEGVTSGIGLNDVVLRMWSGSACERPL